MTTYNSDWAFKAEWAVADPLTLPQVAEDETFSDWQTKRSHKPAHSQAYREGYQDGKFHMFSLERGAIDTEYWNGYQAAVKEEQRVAMDSMIERYVDQYAEQYAIERDEVSEQRFGWMR